MSWKRDIGHKLRELRLVLCQTSENSLGARNFIKQNYPGVIEHHPDFLFIVRECANAHPTVMARYDYGVERRIPVDYLPAEEIEGVVEQLVRDADVVNKHL